MEFLKVPFAKFYRDCIRLNISQSYIEIKAIWDNIRIPTQNLKNPEEYIFYLPYPLCVQKNEQVIIPTGICLDDSNENIRYIFNADCVRLHSFGLHIVIAFTSDKNMSLKAGEKYLHIYCGDHNMKLKKEYESLFHLLRKIVTNKRQTERQRLGIIFLSRLANFEKRLDNIEKQIDKIADRVTNSSEHDRFKKDFIKIDTAMDTMIEIQKLKKGDTDGNKNTGCSGFSSCDESHEKSASKLE